MKGTSGVETQVNLVYRRLGRPIPVERVGSVKIYSANIRSTSSTHSSTSDLPHIRWTKGSSRNCPK